LVERRGRKHRIFSASCKIQKEEEFHCQAEGHEQVITDQEDKKQAVWKFCNNLLGMSGQEEFTLDL
jgi:hypothetical protein